MKAEAALDRAAARRRARSAEERLFRQVFRPPPDLTPSEWADEYRVMSAEETAEPGRWRTSRVPYLREIMDAAVEPGVERVVVMKAGQVGATEVLKNVLGYFIDREPCPILVVMGSLDEAQKWSKEKLSHMIESTPALDEAVADPSSRTSDNTILSKSFAGGHLGIVGATSPKGLRMRHRRVLLMDEVDSYPASAGSEGDPVSLAEKRTETYYNRVIYLASTPTVKGFSRIEDAFEGSDQRFYHVPCPECGAMQRLRWAGIRYEDNRPETARLVCGAGEEEDSEWAVDGCGALIEERHKMKMVRNGEWVPHAPERDTRGYHVNSLYSPFVTWERVVAKHLEALAGGREERKAWVNGFLGETWEEGGERLNTDALARRVEPYPPGVDRMDQLEDAPWRVPEGAGLLTASVDVQDDRLELLVKGWGRDEESWQLAWERLEGDPGGDKVWRDLEYHLTRTWPHEGGGKLTIQACAIDTGGHHTDSVYEYVAPRQGRHVLAIKGSNQEGAPIVGRGTNKKRGDMNRPVKLFPIGTVAAKDLIFSRLKVEKPGPGYIHFPAWLDREYFEQLTAEKVRTKYRAGRPIRRYVKTRPRNEALDLEVYALAALRYMPARVRNNLGEIADRVAAGASVSTPGSGQQGRRRRRRVRSKGLDA